ncbi:MAG: DNA polymerase III subunit delta' [Pseudomonadota bacterium]
MPSVYLADFPEPDRVAGAPHPRETRHLLGHVAEQAEFLSVYLSGRLHHAWLISGQQGVGKATLAWRLARFLLATPVPDGGMFDAPPPTTLTVPDDHPVARRLAVLSEPGLFLLRRGLTNQDKAVSQVISVNEVREMKDYFQHKMTDANRRVAIIDSADDLNPNAANALLKLLEEPPAGVTFILIAHQPHRLLPTIRSRCRQLRLSPLSPDDLAQALLAAGGEVQPADQTALAELAGGSVGEAFRLTNLDGLKIYADLVALFATLPRMDRPRALALVEKGAARGAEGRFDLMVTLIDLFLARLARAGSLNQAAPQAAAGEADLFARLAPTPHAARGWADLAQTLSIRARRGKAVNLDPAALLMDMFLKIDETAGTLAQR